MPTMTARGNVSYSVSLTSVATLLSPVTVPTALVIVAGLGTVLAASLLGSDSLAQIPTAAYTFGCMLTGTLVAAAWAGKSRVG